MPLDPDQEVEAHAAAQAIAAAAVAAAAAHPPLANYAAEQAYLKNWRDGIADTMWASYLVEMERRHLQIHV